MSLSSVTSTLIVVVAVKVASFTGYVITTVGAVMSGFRLSKASSHENIKINIGSSSFLIYSSSLGVFFFKSSNNFFSLSV